MNRSLVCLLLLASFAPALRAVEVQALGNAGVAVSSGDRVVLIDALFGAGLGGYEAVPLETRRSLEKAAAPWNRVRLILGTHHHRDHFDAAAVARHLAANPNAELITTPQAIALLEEVIEESDPRRERLRSVLPEPGASQRIEIDDGLAVVAFNLHHGERNPPVANLGLIVEIGGQRLIHVGDTEVRASEIDGLEIGELDLAIVPTWFLGSARFTPMLEILDARELMGVHLAAASAPAGYFGGSASSRAERQLELKSCCAAWVPEIGATRTLSRGD